MKTINALAAVIALSAMSFGAMAAQPATATTANNQCQACAIEAGSNIAKTSDSTGRTMDDAFNVYTLVAGEWY